MPLICIILLDNEIILKFFSAFTFTVGRTKDDHNSMIPVDADGRVLKDALIKPKRYFNDKLSYSQFPEQYNAARTDWDKNANIFKNKVNNLEDDTVEENYFNGDKEKPHIRRKRQAEVTVLPGHRGRLKIVEGVQWHDDLLDINSDAFLQLEEDIIIMVSSFVIHDKTKYRQKRKFEHILSLVIS